MTTPARPRRGHNEGSLYQRQDGRWVGQITLDNRERKYFYGRTREDVRKRVLRALNDRQENRPVVPEKLTVAVFLESWLAVARTSVRLSTYGSYQMYVRRHIAPKLGTIRVARLTATDVQTFYAEKLSEGLSPTTVVQMHRILHRSLKQALGWGLVAVNVCDSVTPPTKKRMQYRTLDADEARRFLDAARGNPFEALYVLALSTGLRQGELLALHWRDIDMDNGTLSVRATLRRDSVDKTGLLLCDTKTDKSRRQIILTGMAIAALRQHRVRQTEDRLKAGPAWEDNELVFSNGAGKPIEAGNLLRRSFWPLLVKAGLPRIRFHDLRHSAATLLMSQGVHPKVVSEMLGHSQISVTLDLYSHTVPSMHQEAARVMDRLLGGRP